MGFQEVMGRMLRFMDTMIQAGLFLSDPATSQKRSISRKCGQARPGPKPQKWLFLRRSEAAKVVGNSQMQPSGPGSEAVVNGQGFMAQDITFRNISRAQVQQSVALRATADSCTFYRCKFDGFQDTLYAHFGKQFYRECTILGTIDIRENA
ncbi:PREDICTED: pectinesterase 3-like [Nicotiana attenuata]|uniref:pectinesterase 3-like n=1 Tax=Nicotiana attenuata TaxID=49451 RepID=UPI00090529D4|nr:PREDICTED: pectinesterase 3-like [Nicotiana attenuata]